MGLMTVMFDFLIFI